MLEDMEDILENEADLSEETIDAIRCRANYILSEKQLENKGERIGHFSARWKGYIDVYEKAIKGKFVQNGYTKYKQHAWGVAYLKEVFVENGALYIVTYNKIVYKIMHLRNADVAEYMINNCMAKQRM